VIGLRAAVPPVQIQRAFDDAERAVYRRLPRPRLRSVHGLAVTGSVVGRFDTVEVVSRDGLCGQVTVTGRCATANNEVMVAVDAARILGVAPGDPLRFQPGAGERLRLLVVGLYQPVDPTGSYWAIGGRSAPDLTGGGAPLLVSAGTIEAASVATVQARVDMIIVGNLFLGTDPASVDRAAELLRTEAIRAGFDVTSSVGALVTRIDTDQRLVDTAVPAMAAQLLLMCWFALLLAVRYTGDGRRTDLGLLQLRGVRGWRAWLLVSGQSAAPVALGAVVGAGPGYLLAVWLSGPTGATGVPMAVLGRSAGWVAAAVAGTLLAAVLAEWRTFTAPVVDLMRRVPRRRAGWRAQTVDLVAVAVALAGVFQANAVGQDVRGAVLVVRLRLPPSACWPCDCSRCWLAGSGARRCAPGTRPSCSPPATSPGAGAPCAPGCCSPWRSPWWFMPRSAGTPCTPPGRSAPPRRSAPPGWSRCTRPTASSCSRRCAGPTRAVWTPWPWWRSPPLATGSRCSPSTRSGRRG
jgi:hypothetical protein